MKTSEVLDKAADILQERGWAGRDVNAGEAWGENGGPVCLEGAIMAAAGVPRIYAVAECPAYDAVWNYLRTDHRWGLFRDRLYSWNDQPDRTAAEVIEVLRATALLESAKEQPEPVHEDADERAEVGAK